MNRVIRRGGSDERSPDRRLPVLLALGIFLGLWALALARAHTQLGSYDLGYFRQAAWLIAHGHPPFVTIRGLHLLGDHASFLFFPMAWTTSVLPTTATLLAIQAGSLAAGALPLWAVCRRMAGLGVAASAAVVVAYGLHPAVHNVNLADFHPEVAAVPALLGAVVFAHGGRWWPYAGCLAVALLTKEDLSVVVVFLGVLLVGQRRWRPGLATAAVGAAVLVADVALVQPHFAGGFVPSVFFNRYGDGVGDIVRTALGHPLRLLGDLATIDNLALAGALLMPVLLLPLLAARYLVPAIPVQLLYLLSNRPTANTIEGHYVVAMVPFLFVATAMGLGRLCRHGATDRSSSASSKPLLLALVAAALIANITLSKGGVLNRPWEWANLDDVDAARLAGARLVPAGAPVAGTVRTWPLVSQRRHVYDFPSPWVGYEPRKDPVPLPVRQERTRWLFLDTHDRIQWEPHRQRALDRLVPELGFRKIFDRHGILVFRR